VILSDFQEKTNEIHAMVIVWCLVPGARWNQERPRRKNEQTEATAPVRVFR